MIETSSFSKILAYAIASLIFFVFVQLIVIPYQRIHSYKQEGFTKHFFPIIGFWQYFQRRGKISLKELSQECSNGKVLITHVGRTIMFLLKDTAYKKDFFHKQHLYHKAEPVMHMKVLMGNGLVFVEDENWKRHRKLISASFHYDFLKANMTLIQNTVREFFDKLSPEDYENYSVIHRAEQMTGEIVGRIFFGEKLNEYTFEEKPLTLALADIVVELHAVGMTPLVALFGRKALTSPLIPRYRKIMQRVNGFREVCFNIIKVRKTSPQQSNDLLKALLATQESNDPEKFLSDEDIVDEFVTFFMAGMDTTGHLAGMALFNLANHPEYMKDIREEINNTYKIEENVSSETLQKMDALHSVLKETLRLHSPAPIMGVRVAKEDHHILDLEIKKGDYISSDVAATGYDETYFENPHIFDPRRWKNISASDKKLDPYAFTPFAGGPRNCIGQHLAIIEAKVIVSEFLKRFEFRQKDGYHLQMIIKPIFGPKDDILFDLTPISA